MHDLFFAVSGCYNCSAWRIPHRSDYSLSALRTTGGRRAYADVCCRGRHPKVGEATQTLMGISPSSNSVGRLNQTFLPAQKMPIMYWIVSSSHLYIRRNLCKK